MWASQNGKHGLLGSSVGRLASSYFISELALSATNELGPKLRQSLFVPRACPKHEALSLEGYISPPSSTVILQQQPHPQSIAEKLLCNTRPTALTCDYSANSTTFKPFQPLDHTHDAASYPREQRPPLPAQAVAVVHVLDSGGRAGPGTVVDDASSRQPACATADAVKARGLPGWGRGFGHRSEMYAPSRHLMFGTHDASSSPGRRPTYPLGRSSPSRRLGTAATPYLSTFTRTKPPPTKNRLHLLGFIALSTRTHILPL